MGKQSKTRAQRKTTTAARSRQSPPQTVDWTAVNEVLIRHGVETYIDRTGGKPVQGMVLLGLRETPELIADLDALGVAVNRPDLV
jgi:hypothetical protein